MNDVEQDLRELFERKASSMGGVAPRLPNPVRKRGRRRQLGTALVGGLTALAVLAGSVVMLRAVDTGRDRQPTPSDDPWAGYEVFERTATVGSFTITSESDWYLVKPATDGLCGGEEPCEVLQLSNFDPGLGGSVCDEPLPPDGVALVVSSGLDLNPRNVPPWPVTIEVPNTLGRCGEGRYFHFLDEGNLAPYEAWIAQGQDASDRAVARLLRSFQGMTIESTGLMATGDAAYVVAGGENAAGPWRLELRRSDGTDPRSNIVLEAIHAEGGVVGFGDVALTDFDPIEQAGGDPVFGAVVKEADAVELQLEDGTPAIPAQLFPLPPSLPFDFDLFFASNDADVQATAVPIGMPGSPSSPPRSDQPFEELMRVHGGLETALHGLWSELAAIHELEGELQAAQRDLHTLTDEIGAGGPTEEQADQVAAYQRLITRFTRSMSELVTATTDLRTRIENLRGVRDRLVGDVDPAQFPLTVTVTCTGDGEGGTLVSGPAILAQEDGVHIDVVNAIQGERVFFDVGTSEAPIEVADGSSAEVVLDRNVPRTLEVVCTYETRPRTWQRPTHPLTVIDVRI